MTIAGGDRVYEKIKPDRIDLRSGKRKGVIKGLDSSSGIRRIYLP
jgi:hypothetical protein